MRTDQATLVLASLLRTPRRFQSHDLARVVKDRVIALGKILEEFEEMASLEDCPQALAKIDAAYRLLGAEPPAAIPEDIPERAHPVLTTIDNPDPMAELSAWRALLSEGAP